MVEKRVTGNYEMNLVLTGELTTEPVKVLFSGGYDARQARRILAISVDGFKIVRETGTDTRTWKTHNNIGKPPWNVRVLKKGNFFRFWVNDTTGWIRGPLGEWENTYEPMDNHLSVETPAGISLQSCAVTTLPWLQEITKPAIPCGPKGSFYEEQIIPGAIIEYEGSVLHVCYGGNGRRRRRVFKTDDRRGCESKPQAMEGTSRTSYLLPRYAL